MSGSQVAGVGAAAETPRSGARSRGLYSLLHISAEASLHHGVHRVYMDGTAGALFQGLRAPEGLPLAPALTDAVNGLVQ